MNPNVALMLFMFFIFFVFSQCNASESFGGTAWFPYGYLQTIRHSMGEKFTNLFPLEPEEPDDDDEDQHTKAVCDAKIMNEVEAPSFTKFDIGNKFATNTDEVSSWYFGRKNDQPDVALFEENMEYNDGNDVLSLSNGMSQFSAVDVFYNRGGNATGSYQY